VSIVRGLQRERWYIPGVRRHPTGGRIYKTKIYNTREVKVEMYTTVARALCVDEITQDKN
jgi:hypothetical protein